MALAASGINVATTSRGLSRSLDLVMGQNELDTAVLNQWSQVQIWHS